jgi:ABC-type nitrate/sulfonate/bicarbonate transport system substrate-binding protein
MTTLSINEFVAPGIEVLARGLGYFEADGLELEVTRTPSSTEQRRCLMANECDVALTAIDNLIAWDAGGDDLRLIAQVERTTVLDLIAQPNVGSVADLRGSVLAVDAADNGFAVVLRRILGDHGVGATEFTFQPEGGIKERLNALAEGRAAAALLGPPWSHKALDRGLHRLTTVETALPAFPGIGLAVRAGRLEQLADALKLYIGALDRAARWVVGAERDEALRLLIDAGFDERGSADVLMVSPSTLVPSRPGVELLYEMRRELGMLSDRAPSLEVLLEPVGAFHAAGAGRIVP